MLQLTEIEARNMLLSLVRYLGSHYMEVVKDGRIMCQDEYGLDDGYLVYVSRVGERPFSPYQYIHAMSGLGYFGTLRSIVGYVVTTTKLGSRRLAVNSLDELAIKLELEGFPAV